MRKAAKAKKEEEAMKREHRQQIATKARAARGPLVASTVATMSPRPTRQRRPTMILSPSHRLDSKGQLRTAGGVSHGSSFRDGSVPHVADAIQLLLEMSHAVSGQSTLELSEETFDAGDESDAFFDATETMDTMEHTDAVKQVDAVEPIACPIGVIEQVEQQDDAVEPLGQSPARSHHSSSPEGEPREGPPPRRGMTPKRLPFAGSSSSSSSSSAPASSGDTGDALPPSRQQSTPRHFLGIRTSVAGAAAAFTIRPELLAVASSPGAHPIGADERIGFLVRHIASNVYVAHGEIVGAQATSFSHPSVLAGERFVLEVNEDAASRGGESAQFTAGEGFQEVVLFVNDEQIASHFLEEQMARLEQRQQEREEAATRAEALKSAQKRLTLYEEEYARNLFEAPTVSTFLPQYARNP